VANSSVYLIAAAIARGEAEVLLKVELLES
jgi:hypothetical protein